MPNWHTPTPPLPPPTPPLSPSTLPLKRRHHPSLPRNSWLVHLLVGLCMSVSWSGLGCVRLLVGLQPTQERTPSTSATQFHPHSSSFADKYVSSSFLQKISISFLGSPFETQIQIRALRYWLQLFPHNAMHLRKTGSLLSNQNLNMEVTENPIDSNFKIYGATHIFMTFCHKRISLKL